MELLRPIFWGQGMFLQPQHFQQQDAYHETRLWHALHALQPFCWGVQSLSIREAALQNFVFEVERCEVMTWNGTMLRFQGDQGSSNARLVPRSFETILESGKPLSVYLGLKRWQREEGNVAPVSASANGMAGEKHWRFRLQETTTPDLLADDGQRCSVHYLMHEVRILFEGEPILQTQDYELLKIAEVLRVTEGQGAVLSRRYIPPALSVHAVPELANMLKEIRDLLTAKGRELAEYKRQRSIHTIEMGSRDTVYLLMMQTVNRYIPLFHHHLEITDTHPCSMYALLRQFIGDLSTFSDTVSVLGGPLPPYQHEHLWECFSTAVNVARDLLSELTKGPEYVIPLVFDQTFFTADLTRQFFEGNHHYYLSIKIDMPPRELERHLMETGKVCSREEMPVLQQRALPGLVVRYLEAPPEELPRRAHCIYFELDHYGPLWRRIEQRQNIAVYCQLPPQETEMQLLVI